MKIQLKNGMWIVGEKMPYVRSIAIGVWVGVGSRAESKAENGISHFTEHMLFKGTGRRTAQDIACEMDAIGGNLNAFTAREYTCYYAKTVDEDVEKAFDILSDMYLESTFGEKETELERGVILEEINMYEDTPEDVAQELLSKVVWSGDPLGFEIAGTKENVLGITPEKLRIFTGKYYNAENTVIAVAGNFDEARIEELAEKYFGTAPHGENYTDYKSVPFSPGTAEKTKDITETHIEIGFPGVGQNTKRQYAMAVLSAALGGGMSSRLFQKIREEAGLAYAVGASPESYKNAGILSVYAAVSPENTERVREMIFAETEDIAKNGFSRAEISRSISQIHRSFIMGLESVSGRMMAIGRDMLLYGRTKSAEEILRDIESVTGEEVTILAGEILTGERAEAFVRPQNL